MCGVVGLREGSGTCLRSGGTKGLCMAARMAPVVVSCETPALLAAPRIFARSGSLPFQAVEPDGFRGFAFRAFAEAAGSAEVWASVEAASSVHVGLGGTADAGAAAAAAAAVAAAARARTAVRHVHES